MTFVLFWNVSKVKRMQIVGDPLITNRICIGFKTQPEVLIIGMVQKIQQSASFKDFVVFLDQR